MLEKFDRTIRALNKVILGVLVGIIGAMLVVCLLHVFYRYVLNNSLSWSEEFMRVTLVWFCMLSVTILAARREHVSIVIFKEKMPKKINKGASRLTQIITVLVCVVVTIIGLRMVLSVGSRATPAMGIPYALAYAAIPIAFVIVTLYELRNLLADISKTGHAHAAVEKTEENPLLESDQ